MEELAHDLATDNRSCGSLGPTTGRSSSTASGHGDRGERHAHIVARHGRFQFAEGGVSVVARPTVCLFVPKVAPSKHWVAKILVEVLVAHDLADIGKKNELELARVHWHAKEMATIQTKTNLWVMTKILVEVLVSHDLADIGKKNELELARVHWHAKNGNHPNKDQSLGHDQNFGKVHFGHNPNTPQ